MAEARKALADTMDAMTATVDTQFASAPPAERALAQKVLGSIAANYRGMSDAALSATLLEEAHLILGYGGAKLTQGRPLPFDTSIDLPILDRPMRVAGQVVLKEVGPDTITIVTTSASNPADVKAAVTAFLDKMVATIAPAQRETILTAVKTLDGFQMNEELTLMLDRTTGLPRTATYRKRTSIADQAQIETKTFRSEE